MPKNLSINRAEYWVMDAVLESSLFLSAVVVENIEETFNREGHGLNYSQLVDTLYCLFQRGNLIAYYHQNIQNYYLNRNTFIPNKTEIIAGLKGNLVANICYKLTAQGGAKWESVSNPNWNRYYTPIYSERETDNKSYVAGGSRRILEEFLAFEIANPFRTVNINSIEWALLEPWKATYWKTLPIGYQLSYSAEDIPCNSQEEFIKADMFSYCFFQWQQVNNWYEDYFDNTK